MNISIFGTGYVGLVTGACLAESGHDIYCVDVDKDKIDLLNSGQIPIYEPGLKDLVSRNLAVERIHFATDSEAAVNHAEETLSKMKKRIVFHVASNPEFLKEGDAVNDFMKPDRIILGCDDELTEKTLKSIYAPFTRRHDCCIVMDIKSAELTKYASNAMLASKISIMNELSHIAERVGADIEQVRIGIGSDSRIGYPFIYPGIGYGGSCLPKDIRSLSSTAKAQGYDTRILNAVEEVNQEQKKALIDKILFHFKGSVTDCVFGLWGLSFKPKTDDMREAPSRIIIETLTELGAKIKAYDPVAMKECE